MATVTTSIQSPLPSAEVLRILTDFSPARSQAWPGVDDAHLQVHGQGEGWADVTEGNKATWERERYTWDEAAGTVAAETTDSNVWAAGSRWDYRLTPNEHGTEVTVTLTRHGRNLKGRLIGALLPLAGASVVRKSLSAALKVGP
jgi:Polyketide cyclase / dehydrase and lipid transport